MVIITHHNHSERHLNKHSNNYNVLSFTGGRVLITVNVAPTLAMAAARATQAARHILFDGKQFRTDIAHKGIARYNID